MRARHQIVNTCYGEVMVREENNELCCYIGDNYDDFIGTIYGSIYDDDLAGEIEVLIEGCQNDNRGETFQK